MIVKKVWVRELGVRSCDEIECASCGYPFDLDDCVVEVDGGDVFCGNRCMQDKHDRAKMRANMVLFERLVQN